MPNNERILKLKKLDALYITHNPLDCLMVYFCVCFAFIRMVYDALGSEGAVRTAYATALIFTVCAGIVMKIWAKRTFKELKLDGIL